MREIPYTPVGKALLETRSQSRYSRYDIGGNGHVPVGQLAADPVLLALPEPMTTPKVENLRRISELPHSGHFVSLSASA